MAKTKFIVFKACGLIKTRVSGDHEFETKAAAAEYVTGLPVIEGLGTYHIDEVPAAYPWK